MIPVEYDQECGRRGRHEDQPILSECVRPKETLPGILVSHHILLSLIDSVQHRKVKIRRGVILGPVTWIRSEELMRDQGREREGEGRIAARMSLPLREV